MPATTFGAGAGLAERAPWPACGRSLTSEGPVVTIGDLPPARDPDERDAAPAGSEADVDGAGSGLYRVTAITSLYDPRVSGPHGDPARVAVVR